MAPTQKVETVESMPEPAPASTPTHDEIAALAYTFWQERGCPDGSPELDWLKAEEELTTKRELTADGSRIHPGKKA